jgi:HK97 family phage major capsid protein
MSDMKKNDALVNEAKTILHNLRSHQQNSENKLSQIETQIEDLKLAQRKMAEAYTKAPTVYTGKDADLKKYIRKDGSLQLRAEKKQINIGGQGTITIEAKGLLDDKETSNEWQARLIDINRKRNFARSLMLNPHTPTLDLKLQRHLSTAPDSVKAGIERAYTGGAGAGQEWTQAELISELHETYEAPLRLRSLLPVQEVSRGSLIIPTLTRGGQPYIQSTISTDDPRAAANLYPASTVSTGQTVINMGGMSVRFVVDQAASEDSALALASVLGRNISESIEAGFEDCMINGDTTGAQDDIANWTAGGRWTVPAAAGTDHRLSFNGFRKLADSKASRSTPAAPANVLFSDVVSALAEMDQFGAATQDNIMVVSSEFLVRNLLDMTQLATLDKFGPQATVLSGQIGSLLGMPVVISRFMTADLNASGVYDNITKTQTGYVIFNRNSYVQYLRRGLQIESQKTIASGSYELVASMRSVMGSADAAGAKNVAYQYNIDG